MRARVTEVRGGGICGSRGPRRRRETGLSIADRVVGVVLRGANQNVGVCGVGRRGS